MDKIKSIMTKFSNDILKQETTSSLEVLEESSSANIQFYQNNFLYNHLDHLESAFKASKIVLGEKNFQYFARLFLMSSPPRVTDVNQYGEGLSVFLGSRDELSEIGYLTHIAKLDWFWFTQSESEIALPKGIFKLWNALLDGDDLSGIEIDESEMENIFYK